MTKPGHNGGIAADRLKSFIERIERLEDEKAQIAADIKEVYAEAKSTGFVPKVMRQIVKLRAMEAAEREEQEALLDIYKAAMGMLVDTPLGEAAIRRLSKKPEQKTDSQVEAEEPTPLNDADQTPEVTMDEARQMGAAAAEQGKPILSNPFKARDPKRAAWDEAWCQASGSDGMDIPDAWKKTPKPKKPDAEQPGQVA